VIIEIAGQVADAISIVLKGELHRLGYLGRKADLASMRPYTGMFAVRLQSVNNCGPCTDLIVRRQIL
jgi:hypothetical protein